MIEFLKNIQDMDWLIHHGGLYVVMAIIFAETGLFLGFFLPGDYLLFITGMIIANTSEPFSDPVSNLMYWNTLIATMAILGNFVGYWFGRRSGEYLLQRKDSLLFKKKNLQLAKEFYDKRGSWAIVIGRFLPIVRTFAPIVAGMVSMELRKFSFYNILGAVVWVFSIVSVGFWLGEYEWVKNNIEYIVIGLVVVTGLPLIRTFVFKKGKLGRSLLVKEKESQPEK